MSTCAKCGTPVYFAERRTSLGKDWHPGCLNCFECGKRLHPGQHAEHRHRPYCHVPCYSLLFGPTAFRHGVGVNTGQESPETRRRMLGEQKAHLTLIGDNQPTRSPLTSGRQSGPGSSASPSSSSSWVERKRSGKEKLEEIIVKEEKDIRARSPALLPFANYGAAQSPSSPSRLRCRKRLYDAELECNLPKDVNKDQLFRSIQTYNEYYTSPTSSGFLGDATDGSVGQNWKFLIDYKERNGKFILECMLKIRWGVKRYIQFLEKDEVDPVVWRRSYLARLEDSETPILQLLERDSYKKRQSFQSVINHSTLAVVKADGEESKCKSPKKEARQAMVDGLPPAVGEGVKSSRSFYDNVPSMLSMLENGADILAAVEVDEGSASRDRRSPAPSTSSSTSSPAASRSPSPRRAAGSSSIGKKAKKKSVQSTSSSNRRSPTKNKASPSSKPSTSFNQPNMISSRHYVVDTSGSQPPSSHNSRAIYSETEEYKTALAQFYSINNRPEALATNNDAGDVTVSEDEGFHTGVPEDEIFYTAKSDFFKERNPFPFYYRDNSKEPPSPSRSFVAQLCSPDKRLAAKNDQRSSTDQASFLSASRVSAGRQTCSLPRRGSSSASTASSFVGGPLEDLDAESEKWKREAERWRRKFERDKESRSDVEKVTLRQSGRRRPKKSRQPSINGHIYNPKTRVFMPEFDTVSTVRVDNMLRANDVVQLLLSKFRIENDPKEFMLYVVKSNGETFAIDDDDFPLYIRLRLGPCHDESQFYLMERNAVETIPAEVAMLMALPMPVLERMEWELQQKQKAEENLIRQKMADYKNVILKLLRERKPRRP